MKRTITQYGLKSQLAQLLLQFIFTADTFIQADVQTLVRLIMPPHQQIQSYKNWEGACKKGEARHQGDTLLGITAQQLLGEGPWSTATGQAQSIDEVLHLSQQLACNSILPLPDGLHTQVFRQICQGGNKDFNKFTDHLHRAIYDHPSLDPEK